MLDLPDKGFQSPGVVVFRVLGAEEERDVLLLGPPCDVAQVARLARLLQFGAVALFELFPAMRLVPEPPPQLVARREIPSPVREPGPILRDPPGPDAVHEDTPTVFLVRLLVHPLDLDVHVPPQSSPRTPPFEYCHRPPPPRPVFHASHSPSRAGRQCSKRGA